MADQDRDDIRWMQATLAYSRRNLGLTAPNPCVGAVVVRDGVVAGRGITRPGGRPHAEQIALAQAGDRARGATIYVTLEPCARRSRTGDGPSCTDAILAAGIARVVIAAPDPSPFAAGEGTRRLLANGIEVGGRLDTRMLALRAGSYVLRVAFFNAPQVEFSFMGDAEPRFAIPVADAAILRRTDFDLSGVPA